MRHSFGIHELDTVVVTEEMRLRGIDEEVRVDSIYNIADQCLDLLDRRDMDCSQRDLIRRNIREIQELLQDDPFHLLKGEFFAREKFENLLLEIRDLPPRTLKIADVYPVFGITKEILRVIKE